MVADVAERDATHLDDAQIQHDDDAESPVGQRTGADEVATVGALLISGPYRGDVRVPAPWQVDRRAIAACRRSRRYSPGSATRTEPEEPVMTTPGDEPAAAAGPARKRRRAVLVLTAVVVAFIVLGLVVVLSGRNRAGTDPLDSDAPALADVAFHTKGCSYEPDRGGLVVHFAVSTRDAGRFTVDVAAVTDEGADNLDIATTHVVRFTVPFYGGRTRQEFDVVVPLTKAEYQQGYRRCRYTVNGA